MMKRMRTSEENNIFVSEIISCFLVFSDFPTVLLLVLCDMDSFDFSGLENPSPWGCKPEKGIAAQHNSCKPAAISSCLVALSSMEEKRDEVEPL